MASSIQGTGVDSLPVPLRYCSLKASYHPFKNWASGTLSCIALKRFSDLMKDILVHSSMPSRSPLVPREAADFLSRVTDTKKPTSPSS